MLKFIKKSLNLGVVYNLFIFITGNFGYAKLYLFAKYLPYSPGRKILDLGCGPGTNTQYFKALDYLGIDIYEPYIKKAASDYPDYQFYCENFLNLSNEYNNSFDVILMSGLLHHLPDSIVIQFLEKSYAVLREGGSLIAIENCLVPEQSPLKRKVILLDRGEFVRTSAELDALLSKSQFSRQISIEDNLLLIPYTHAIINCRK